MSAADRHWASATPGERHRGGADGDVRLAKDTLARCGGDAARAERRLLADAAEPCDRAEAAGADALTGYVARRKRVAAAFRQGAYRPCRRCGRLAFAPHDLCAPCDGRAPNPATDALRELCDASASAPIMGGPAASLKLRLTSVTDTADAPSPPEPPAIGAGTDAAARG